MVEAQKHDTVQTWFHALVSRHFAGSLKPPFNEEARALAGFDESWYRPLALDDEKRRREQAERGRSEARRPTRIRPTGPRAAPRPCATA